MHSNTDLAVRVLCQNWELGNVEFKVSDGIENKVACYMNYRFRNIHV